MPKLTAKKNIIFFSLESMRAGFFESFGGLYSSPQMSRLAKRSCVFKNMFSAAPSTTMSLSTVINGRYAHQFPRFSYVDDTVFPDNLFSMMRQTGRRNFLCLNDSMHPNNTPKIHSGDDVEMVVIPRTGKVTTDMAKKVIELSKSTEEPFFLVAHGSPLGFCDEADLPNWRTGLERAVWHNDQAIGMLLDNINLEETTLVVYGDHGLLTGEHYHLMKHAFFLYDEGLNVPCLVTDGSPKCVEEVCSLTNLRALVVDGSFAPPGRALADSQYVQQPHRMTMVRDSEWKYIAHYHWKTAVTGVKEELYDLKSDPHEHRNLLHLVSRHPLRYEWTQAEMDKFDNTFSFNSRLLSEKLSEYRRLVAAIWKEGVERLIEHRDPLSSSLLAQKFEAATPEQILALVGPLIESLNDKEPNYGGEKRAQSLEPEFHLKYFPELPRGAGQGAFSG